MGYYTLFQLEIEDGVMTYDEYMDELENFTGIYISDDCYKWYDHDDDMVQFSLNHPNVLFILTGYGEDREDIWRSYYRNGSFYTVNPEVKFPPFDPDELN